MKKPIVRTPENEDHWAVLDRDNTILFHHEDLQEAHLWAKTAGVIGRISFKKLGFYMEVLPEWSKHNQQNPPYERVCGL